MNKLLFFILLLITCFISEEIESDINPDALRLIEFNETYREWMSFAEILKMKSECGKSGEHGGFIDVTDHPLFYPIPIKNIDFPDQPTHEAIVNSLIKDLNKEMLHDYVKFLSNFDTRYYTSSNGKKAALDIQNIFLKSAQGRTDVSVRLFTHNWLQPSVIARIEGSGSNKDEVVIIGAHEDSINTAGLAPGADDDASGVAVVLETFRVLMSNDYRPSRSVEFHTYSAEEVGLRGSMAIADDYQKKGIKVVSMAQFDMTMYPGSGGKMGIVTDYVNRDLTAFLRKLVNVYSSIEYIETKCGYGCSDHASWTKAGFPSCFPFEADFRSSNKNIHTRNDLIAKLSMEHGLEFAKVALGFIVELADD